MSAMELNIMFNQWFNIPNIIKTKNMSLVKWLYQNKKQTLRLFWTINVKKIVIKEWNIGFNDTISRRKTL